MNREQKIRAALALLKPQKLEIIDESYKHAGHEGAKEGKGHFRITIISCEFAGKNPLARHRLVYAALGDLMKQDIHALSMTALAPEEVPPEISK